MINLELRPVHDAVREVIPNARVCYVDIDPVAVARLGTAWLAGVQSAGVAATGLPECQAPEFGP